MTPSPTCSRCVPFSPSPRSLVLTVSSSLTCSASAPTGTSSSTTARRKPGADLCGSLDCEHDTRARSRPLRPIPPSRRSAYPAPPATRLSHSALLSVRSRNVGSSGPASRPSARSLPSRLPVPAREVKLESVRYSAGGRPCYKATERGWGYRGGITCLGQHADESGRICRVGRGRYEKRQGERGRERRSDQARMPLEDVERVDKVGDGRRLAPACDGDGRGPLCGALELGGGGALGGLGLEGGDDAAPGLCVRRRGRVRTGRRGKRKRGERDAPAGDARQQPTSALPSPSMTTSCSSGASPCCGRPS